MHLQGAHLGPQAVLEVLIDLGKGKRVIGNLGKTHETGDGQTMVRYNTDLNNQANTGKSSVITKNVLTTASCP